MTEEEAKVTQCCGPEGCGYFNDDPRPARWCVASACMAWRTRHMSPASREAMFRDERRLHPDLSNDAIWSAVNSYDLPDGFCGLAGAPA